MTIHRRSFLAGATAAGVLSASTLRAQAATIKIAVILPLSGSQALVGEPIMVGAQIARDTINAQGGILGKQVEFVPLDDKAESARAVAAFNEATGNGLNLLLGPTFTTTITAVLPLLQNAKAVLIGPTSPDERLRHQLFNRNYFGTFEPDFVRANAYAKVMAERFPNVTNWTGVILDLASGHNNWSAAKKALTTQYEKVAKKKIEITEALFTPLGSTNFKQQISQLAASPAEGALIIQSGADGSTFYQQALTFGLERKMKVFIDGAIDINVGNALKNKVPTNIWICSPWNYVAAKNQVSKDLAAEYIKRTGKLPHAYAALGHAGMLFYASAIKAAGSTDTEKVIAALENVHLETAKGPGYFRKEDHQLLAETYMFTLKPKDQDPGFEVNETVTVNMADIIYPPAPGTEWVD